MKNTTVIFGPPGTGKTTYLLNLVDKYLSEGVDPRKIGFISFTRKSVEEAVTRAMTKFNKDKKFFFYFRTIHSLAFMMLSLSKNQVMEISHYKEVGNLLGISIKGKKLTDYSVEELEVGDQLIFLESLSRMKCETLRETYDSSNVDLTFEELELFQKTLKKYKETNLLYDFTDMLEKYLYEGITPELDVLIVDEAQDLCLLQWKIIERLSEKSKKVFIAGDDDQAIFRWSGADVEYFVELSRNPEHTVKVLDQSYRLPKEVFTLSNTLVNDIVNRVPKVFKSKDVSGKVEFIVSLDEVDLSKDNWLILIRNTYMAGGVIDYVKTLGLAYESQWKSYRENDSLQAAFTWERLRKGLSVTVNDASSMLSYVSNTQKKGDLRKLKNTSMINMESLASICKMSKSFTEQLWYDSLQLIGVDDREYFKAARRRGESLIKPARIHVSTIHGAKGGESDNVVVFTDVSAKTYTSMQRYYDDEIRVFYVAITRAKKNLYIVQQETNTFFPGLN